MTRKFFLGTLLVALAAAAAFVGAQEQPDVSSIKPPGSAELTNETDASSIEQLELGELTGRTEGIVLAKVTKVVRKDDDTDEATIAVVSVIKGNIVPSELTVELLCRGEKNFDPELQQGQMGVFFLREIAESKAKLAYVGSVAIFGKANFMVSEKPKPFEGKSNRVKLETSMGDIVVDLDEKAAPVTVKNFLQYVGEGFYNETVFHRVITDFMVQGGGFSVDMVQKQTRGPIVNEASNGLKNLRGSIAMARTKIPNSATSQFFINHKDNAFLNYVPDRADRDGYAVFGKVVEGMDVVDAIAAVKTTTKMTTNTKGQKSPSPDVPVETVVIKSAMVVAPGK
jgi:cyclophilin family peptidyl-prolyl cis-trans isomerase